MPPHSGEQYVDTLYAAGLHLLTNDRIGDAAEAFRALVVVGEKDERGWLGLAECHRLQGHRRLALELLGIGRAVRGDTCRMLLASGRLQCELGEVLGAERSFDAAEELVDCDSELDGLLQEMRTYGHESHDSNTRAVG
jgi:hypothetical protein